MREATGPALVAVAVAVAVVGRVEVILVVLVKIVVPSLLAAERFSGGR